MATYNLNNTTPTNIVIGDTLVCGYVDGYKSVTLPAGYYRLECWGARGCNWVYYTGSSYVVRSGGNGGYSSGILRLKESTLVYVYPGQFGSSSSETYAAFNGGGASGSNATGGGGGSDIRIGSTSLYARVIVAGGGAGVSGSWSSLHGETCIDKGGDGGGISGSNGICQMGRAPGKGATQTSGYQFGVGGGIVSSDYSGGGGGWYGGYGSSDASGGGSGYVYSETTVSNYPSGCLLNSSYYLSFAVTTQTDESSPAGSGQGYCRITAIENPFKIGGSLKLEHSGAVTPLNLPKGKYKLEVWGAQGGNWDSTYQGGKGGYSVGILTLTESTNLFVYVGGQPKTFIDSTRYPGGFNGGGAGSYASDVYGSSKTYAQGGGGGTDIRIGNDSLYARVIVAGGGAGCSNKHNVDTTRYGGGLTSGAYSGYQATQTSGYQFGVGQSGKGSSGYRYAAAGSGGGWYGGKSSQEEADYTYYDTYTGGGSGYVYTSSTASNYPSGCLLNSAYYLTDAQTIAGNQSFPSLNGGTETGHSGDGACKITIIDIKQDKLFAGDKPIQKMILNNKNVLSVWYGNINVWIGEKSSKETWIINSTPNPASSAFETAINFTSNGEAFKSISIEESGKMWGMEGAISYKNSTSTYFIYESNSGWASDSYRTLTFERSPTGELLTWLQNNAIKQ